MRDDLFRFAVDPDQGPAASTAIASGAGFPDAGECGPVIIRFDGEQVAALVMAIRRGGQPRGG